ncbi:MAG: OmpA family protein [Paludibacteraceae bacterium]|nr:OmpA family protein [Paludibacteraceae bacterium]
MKYLRYLFILLLSFTMVMPAVYAAPGRTSKTEQAKKAAAKKKAAKQKAAQKKKDQRAKKKQQKSNQRAKQQNKKKSSSTTSMTAKQLKAYNARRFDIHNLAVWGGAGYSGLLNGGSDFDMGGASMGSSKFQGLAGGMLGVGYEYNYKKFLLSVGPEFRLISSVDRLNFTEPYDCPMPEYNQIKHYQFEGLSEQQLVGQLTLPVMMGMKLDKWYWKAGVKVGYSLLSNYSQTGTVNPTLTDPDAYDPSWSMLPNHGIAPYPYTAKGKNTFGLDMAASAEIGINLDQFLSQDWVNQNEDRDRPLRMRLAVFADYGLLNQSSQQDMPFVPSYSDKKIATTSLMQSEWIPSKLNSLLVGVKFTFMLQMNKVREEKKQDAYMAVLTYNTKTDRAMAGVPFTIEGNGIKTISKTTNKKGLYSKRFRLGTYTISASAKGYIPVEDMQFTHEEVNDTAYVGLRPIPIYTYVVRDAKTGKAIAARVTFLNANNEEVMLTAATDSIKESNTASLQLNTAYRVHIEAPDYFSYTGSIADIEGNETFTLEPIVKKRKIILHDLYFATNSVVILPESEKGLQDLYDLLNENPEVRIRITGHTDSVGSDKDNQKLSEGRANSVRDDMIRRGIDESRIEAEGKGESEPIDTNDTEEGRAKNRRVEFMIL